MFLVMIIEDREEDALILQKTLLDDNLEATFVVCRNGDDALAYLDSTKELIDIFFIDIDLPTIDGYDVAADIRSREEYITAPIVFVTGYEGDPLSAFQEYHCYSYIKKPFNAAVMHKQLSPLLKTITDGKKAKVKQMERMITINTRTGVSLINVSDILSIEVSGKDLIVHAKNDKYTIPRKTLDSILKDLNEPGIIQCHKSFAVNTEKISGLVKKKRDLWQPINKDTGEEFNCLISRTYYDEVMSKSLNG